jgi:hypothetical protein
MLHRWRKKLSTARFYRLTQKIFDTPPMPVVDAPWTIMSMVSNGDVQMYLLSLKSFYAHIKRGKICAIIDRDMPVESRAILERHFPGIRFVILEDIDTGPCQRGGTWERILHVVEHSSQEYTIQIDCDTLAFGHDLSEVLDCVETNTAFTLGSMGHQIVSFPEAAKLARESRSNFVGLAAERLFDRYPDAAKWKYVRASSGFAGFAKNGIARKSVEDFHVHMEKLLGSRWTEWGTEQNASNFAVANSPNAVVLHRPKYGNFSPGLANEKASFLHFYGTHRFENDFFAKRGVEVIQSLNAMLKAA